MSTPAKIRKSVTSRHTYAHGQADHSKTFTEDNISSDDSKEAIGFASAPPAAKRSKSQTFKPKLALRKFKSVDDFNKINKKIDEELNKIGGNDSKTSLKDVHSKMLSRNLSIIVKNNDGEDMSR